MSEKKKESKDLESSNQDFPAGTALVVENEVSRKMYIIKKGKARVYKTYLGRKITLAILGPGEIFGELSFFDAKPRSASVEALSDLTAFVIDGERATEQIAELPKWIFPIFRSVFQRFRDTDQKITVLQSMNEYQKKTFQQDTSAQKLYNELLRFVKALKLLYEQQWKAQRIVKSDSLLKEFDEVLGNRYIGLRVFWRMLKEHDIVDHEKEEREGIVQLKASHLENWVDYLNAEVKSERFLLLSHSALAILRRLISEKLDGLDPKAPCSIEAEALQLDQVLLAKEGIDELREKKIVEFSDSKFTFVPEILHRTYTYQSILKAFDQTSITLEE